MTNVTLNGRPYKVPSTWQEVKVRQYVRILKEWEPEKDIADRDYFILLKILTDGNFAGMENTLENQITLTSILGWVVTEPFRFSEKLPKVLELSGQKIPIPEDPRDLSIGQNIHLRRDYIEKSKVLEESISIATAIYLQPIIDNSLFKLNRAQEIAKEIDEMPISLIYPIGFFLLRRALGFGLKPVSFWQAVKISLVKILRKTWPGWRRSTGSTATMISR
jgi:hypothetical protein